MPRAWDLFRRRVAQEQGQDLTEYALLAALIAVVAVTTVATFGHRIHDVLWTTIVNAF